MGYECESLFVPSALSQQGWASYSHWGRIQPCTGPPPGKGRRGVHQDTLQVRVGSTMWVYRSLCYCGTRFSIIVLLTRDEFRKLVKNVRVSLSLSTPQTHRMSPHRMFMNHSQDSSQPQPHLYKYSLSLSLSLLYHTTDPQNVPHRMFMNHSQDSPQPQPH